MEILMSTFQPLYKSKDHPERKIDIFIESQKYDHHSNTNVFLSFFHSKTEKKTQIDRMKPPILHP